MTTRAEIQEIFETPHPITQVINEKIDGEIYSYNKSSRCSICRAPQEIQTLVDRLLVDGHSYAEVSRLLNPLQDKMNIPQQDRISYSAIRQHQQQHLPFDRLAAREIIEKRARERGKKIIEGTDNLLTYAAVLEMVQQIGFGEIVAKAQIPNIDQTLKASQLLHELETVSEEDSKVEDVIVKFNVVLEAVKKHVTPEIWSLIVQEIENARSSTPQGELNP